MFISDSAGYFIAKLEVGLASMLRKFFFFKLISVGIFDPSAVRILLLKISV